MAGQGARRCRGPSPARTPARARPAARRRRAAGRPAPAARAGRAAARPTPGRAGPPARRPPRRRARRPGAPNRMVSPGAKIPPKALPDRPHHQAPADAGQPGAPAPPATRARPAAGGRSRAGSRRWRRRRRPGGSPTRSRPESTRCCTQPGDVAAAGLMTPSTRPVGMPDCSCSRPSNTQSSPKAMRRNRRAGGLGAWPGAAPAERLAPGHRPPVLHRAQLVPGHEQRRRPAARTRAPWVARAWWNSATIDESPGPGGRPCRSSAVGTERASGPRYRPPPRAGSRPRRAARSDGRARPVAGQLTVSAAAPVAVPYFDGHR